MVFVCHAQIINEIVVLDFAEHFAFDEVRAGDLTRSKDSDSDHYDQELETTSLSCPC